MEPVVPMAEAGGVREMARAVAVPETLMTWGEPGALSVSVIVSESGPEWTGEKVTEMEQAPAGATEPLQALELVKSATFVPPKATEEMLRAAVPELVTVIMVGPLVAPSEMAEKLRGLGAMVMAGAGGGGGVEDELPQPAAKKSRARTQRERERILKSRFLDK
jgi:hypothetical protein